MPIGSGVKRADAHAEERKVEATNQIISQADNAYGSYMDLHDMQKADLDRSMLSLSEAMDQEAKRRADTNDELFQQEFVENDKQRGLDHLAKIQEIVEKQANVYRNIMAKVAESDAQPKVRKERTDPTDEPNDATNRYRKRNDASVRVANACVVANSHVRKQARYDRFHQNRQLIAIADSEKTESLKASHAEADRLAERRQHELVEKQFHKTLASQQKRNEQQKMLKELQRFQDHQFELLQLKHHPESVSTQKQLPPMLHPQAPQTAPSNSFSSSSKSEPNLRSLNHEPIYKDIQQSHKLFASTLDKWRSFESDNEKRTEAYWRKMLQGDRKKESDSKGSKLAILKRRVTEVNAVRKFVQHTQNSIDGFEIENIDHVDDWTEENIDPDATPPLSPTRAPSPSDATGRKVYSERLEKIRYFQEQKERLAFEKRQRDMKFLEEKVMRSKKMNQERAAKAAESIRQWEEKNMASTMRREADATKNDGELYEKMESRQQMLDEKKGREKAESDDYFGAKNLASLNVREAAKANLAETKKAFQERQAEKHELAQARLEEARVKANERNVSTPDRAQEKLERKQNYEQNHSAIAQQEIEKKQNRHEEAKKRVVKPTSTVGALQKQRLLQKDKEAQGRRLSGSELTLPPELTLPANLFLQSPSNGRRRFTSELTETEPLEMSPREAISQSGDSPKSPSENQLRPRRESRTGSLLTVGKESGSAGFPSPVSRQGPSPTGGSSPHSIQVSGDDDDSSSEGGEGFLQDLQAQSSKWLQDIRKKSVLV